MNVIRPADEFLKQPYWQHLARGVLHLCTCEDCGTAQHPPSAICPKCRSFNMGWKPALGKGKLLSHAEALHPVHPMLADQVPYVITLIELEEGVRMVSGLPKGVKPDLKVGMDMRCKVVSHDADFALPYFLPEDETGE